MGFVVKAMDKAYFKRFQVKYARRRAGKTDYRARLRLCRQSKNKYNTPKYRFSVRFTNKDIVCQIINATMAGDIIVASAYSHQLPKYGLSAGLTNYAAAYCTGLLCARRALTKFGLADIYTGCEEVDGEDYNVEAVEDQKRPLRANLDVGLVRTTTGNRVFGALKGALDGGIDIPHNGKRFAGAGQDDAAELHRGYIFGEHVSAYMEKLEEEEPERYATHFASYIAAGINSENLEETLEACHEKIRESPVQESKPRTKPAEKKNWLAQKITYEERRANLTEKLNALKAMAVSDDEEESDEE